MRNGIPPLNKICLLRSFLGQGDASANDGFMCNQSFFPELLRRRSVSEATKWV